MAVSRFINTRRFSDIIQKLGSDADEIIKKSLYAGAKVLADEMKPRLKKVLSEEATGKLVKSFGISPIRADKFGNLNLHIGFDGYQKPGYGKFRSTGVPFRLIAASFESGAVMGGRYRDDEGNSTRNKRLMRQIGEGDYWRTPTPFIEPSIEAARGEARKAINRTFKEELKKIEK